MADELIQVVAITIGQRASITPTIQVTFQKPQAPSPRNEDLLARLKISRRVITKSNMPTSLAEEQKLRCLMALVAIY